MSVPFSQLVYESDLLVEDGAFEMIDTSGMDDHQPMTSSFETLDTGPLLLHAPDELLPPTSSSHFADWLQNTGPLMSGDAFDDHRYGPSDTDFDRLVNAHHDYYDKIPQMEFDNDQAEHSYAYCLPPTAATQQQHTPTAAAAARGGDGGEMSESPPSLVGGGGSGSDPPSSSSSSSLSATILIKLEPPSPGGTVVQPPPTEDTTTVTCENPATVPEQPPNEHALEEMECAWWSEERGGKCAWRGPRCTVEAHVSATHVGRGIVRPVCRWDGCNKSFVRRYLLLRHVRCLHCDDKPFVCGECGQRFSLRERMKLHQRVMHGLHLQLKLPTAFVKKIEQRGIKEEPCAEYACAQCGEAFPTTAHRRHHVERVHEKSRFACEYCDQLFTDRSALTRHKQRRHGNLKECGRTTTGGGCSGSGGSLNDRYRSSSSLTTTAVPPPRHPPSAESTVVPFRPTTTVSWEWWDTTRKQPALPSIDRCLSVPTFAAGPAGGY